MVGDGMNFGGPSASTAADGLILRPPFPPALQRCAFEEVLSVHCKSAVSSGRN
jgi:hypothetical protein